MRRPDHQEVPDTQKKSSRLRRRTWVLELLPSHI